jgi:hypothetical protein
MVAQSCGIGDRNEPYANFRSVVVGDWYSPDMNVEDSYEGAVRRLARLGHAGLVEKPAPRAQPAPSASKDERMRDLEELATLACDDNERLTGELARARAKIEQLEQFVTTLQQTIADESEASLARSARRRGPLVYFVALALVGGGAAAAIRYRPWDHVRVTWAANPAAETAAPVVAPVVQPPAENVAAPSTNAPANAAAPNAAPASATTNSAPTSTTAAPASTTTNAAPTSAAPNSATSAAATNAPKSAAPTTPSAKTAGATTPPAPASAIAPKADAAKAEPAKIAVPKVETPAIVVPKLAAAKGKAHHRHVAKHHSRKGHHRATPAAGDDGSAPADDPLAGLKP